MGIKILLLHGERATVPANNMLLVHSDICEVRSLRRSAKSCCRCRSVLLPLHPACIAAAVAAAAAIKQFKTGREAAAPLPLATR